MALTIMRLSLLLFSLQRKLLNLKPPPNPLKRLVVRATSLFLCYNIAVSLMDSMSVWIEIVALNGKWFGSLLYMIIWQALFYYFENINFNNQHYRKYILTSGVERSILNVSKTNYRIHKIVEKGEQRWEHILGILAKRDDSSC